MCDKLNMYIVNCNMWNSVNSRNSALTHPEILHPIIQPPKPLCVKANIKYDVSVLFPCCHKKRKPAVRKQGHASPGSTTRLCVMVMMAHAHAPLRLYGRAYCTLLVSVVKKYSYRNLTRSFKLDTSFLFTCHSRPYKSFTRNS